MKLDDALDDAEVTVFQLTADIRLVDSGYTVRIEHRSQDATGAERWNPMLGEKGRIIRLTPTAWSALRAALLQQLQHEQEVTCSSSGFSVHRAIPSSQSPWLGAL